MYKKPPLSKSRYMMGKQCELSLWYTWNRRDLKQQFEKSASPEFEDKAKKFNTGHKIGEIAKNYYPSGVEVLAPFKIEEAAAATRKYIAEGKETIYEATAVNESNRTSASVDILRKVPGTQDEWEMIEVKSAQKLKEYHLDDIAFQYAAFVGAGYKIRNVQLMLVNGPAYDAKSTDPYELFYLQDVTAEAKKRAMEVEKLTAKFNKLSQQTTEPVMPIGPHCSKPHSCIYKFHCWKGKQEQPGGPQ